MANTTNTQQTRCIRCNRVLQSATSITKGMGKGCAAKVRKASADLADYKARQIDQAKELIEDGAIVPLRNQVFITVSTDGSETYLSAPNTCGCPAGRRGSRCYHTAAVRMMLADTTPAVSVVRSAHALAA